MPALSITTVVGVQEYGYLTAEDGFDVYIWKEPSISDDLIRIGYCWLFYRDPPPRATGFLVTKFPVLLPGVKISIPGEIGLTGKQMKLRIEWDFSGIPLNIYF